MKLFFSTSKIEDHIVNEILIKTALEHSKQAGKVHITYKSNLLNKKILLRNFSFSIIFLFIKGLIYSILKPSKTSYISFEGINIGRYAVSTAYRSYNSYNNKAYFIFEYLKSLIKCALFYKAIKPHTKNIELVYIDNPFYENGIFYDIFSGLQIPIYHNEYPYGLVRHEAIKQGSYEDALYVQKSHVSEFDITRGKNQIEIVAKDTSKIPYMLASFDEYNSTKKYDYVLYSHSFTDAQSAHGHDGAFNNIKEWMEYTLNELRLSKVCIKGHPEIYTEGYTAQVIDWDKKLFSEVLEKYKNYPNIDFIDYPVRNADLLDSLSKETILISHHGNALLEGGALGFKCISSKSSNWSKNYEIFNEWKNKYEYKDILSKSFSELIETNYTELYEYYDVLYFGRGSYFAENWWVNRVAELSGVSAADIIKDPNCINDVDRHVVKECVNVLTKELVINNF